MSEKYRPKLLRETNILKRMSGEADWLDWHTEVLDLASQGFSAKPICMQLQQKGRKISLQKINLLMHSNIFKHKLKLLTNTVIAQLNITQVKALTGKGVTEARNRLATVAIQTVEKLIDLSVNGENIDRIKLEACKDILDRIGVRPIEITQTSERSYSPEEVSSARKVLTEAQDIVMRLTNQSSPYIRSDLASRKLESSITDNSSNANAAKTATST